MALTVEISESLTSGSRSSTSESSNGANPLLRVRTVFDGPASSTSCKSFARRSSPEMSFNVSVDFADERFRLLLIDVLRRFGSAAGVFTTLVSGVWREDASPATDDATEERDVLPEVSRLEPLVLKAFFSILGMTTASRRLLLDLARVGTGRSVERLSSASEVFGISDGKRVLRRGRRDPDDV